MVVLALVRVARWRGAVAGRGGGCGVICTGSLSRAGTGASRAAGVAVAVSHPHTPPAYPRRTRPPYVGTPGRGIF